MKVVIIGGVAAGPKTASRIIRMNPEADVTIIERGVFLSYAGCGLPYYISGEVKEQAHLMETPAGVVRDATFFLNVKNLQVKNRTEALEIDRGGKRVRIRSMETGEDLWIGYDKLVISTGAKPIVPKIPGVDKKNVFTLHGVHDAEGIKSVLAEHKAKDVVIIGGGLIGVEATEALATHGCRVTVIEMLPQILGSLDKEIARLVELHMESKGVRILTDTKAIALESRHESDDRVTDVITNKGVVTADMVIMAIGVRPETTLAGNAGLTLGGSTGAIQVDDHMRTSDPDIYAAGDCVECRNRLTGLPCYVPLGSTANKQGRVAAINICGGDETFPGVLGSAVCKVFDFTVARTGLTEKDAIAAGWEVITAMAPGPDRAHYMPQSKPLLMKIVADRKTGRLLGVQVTGPGEGAKRVDVASTAIASAMTLDDVASLDLCYAPHYSPALDNLITAANVARNKRDGLMVGISAEEVYLKMERGEDFILLDARSPVENSAVRIPNSKLIPLGVLRKRLDEVPKHKEIITYCQISLRGYEAALILKSAGFTNVKVLDGGIAMWPYRKEFPE